MSDFSHAFFGYFIAFIALGGIAWCLWLLFTQRRWLGSRPVAGPVDDTGHVWDEDLTELNNPVPRWWTWMYLLLCVFALGYLVLMPGLRSEEHTSELQSLMRISYAVFCLKKKKQDRQTQM